MSLQEGARQVDVELREPRGHPTSMRTRYVTSGKTSKFSACSAISAAKSFPNQSGGNRIFGFDKFTGQSSNLQNLQRGHSMQSQSPSEGKRNSMSALLNRSDDGILRNYTGCQKFYPNCGNETVTPDSDTGSRFWIPALAPDACPELAGMTRENSRRMPVRQRDAGETHRSLQTIVK
jgi:hypothetical protein